MEESQAVIERAPTWKRYNSRWQPGERRLKRWHRGDDVKWLQKCLGCAMDGSFGHVTESSVLAYQHAVSQILRMKDPMGEVFKSTWGSLRGSNFLNLTIIRDGFTVNIRMPTPIPGILELQCRLAARYLYRGRIDGIPGALTRTAFARLKTERMIELSHLEVLNYDDIDRMTLESMGFRVSI